MIHMRMPTELKGETLSLRPLQQSDFDGLFAAASDPKIWEGHPAKDRYKPEVFGPYFEMLLSTGQTCAVRENRTSAIVGCSRFYTAEDHPNDISIGFTFLIRRLWGGSYNRELKTLMLDLAFETYDCVWFHIDPNNVRSRRATEKIGARYISDRTLSFSGKDTTWARYAITKQEWIARG